MLLKGMEFDTAHFITDVSGKYPRLWALKGAHPVTVNRWYKFGVLASIRTIVPGFREISELPDWVGNAVQEQSLVETRPLHQEKKSTEGLEPCGRKGKATGPTKKIRHHALIWPPTALSNQRTSAFHGKAREGQHPDLPYKRSSGRRREDIEI
ncbi:hypothetical protein ACS0TY_019701 [Phlomoides rotata]